MASLQIDPNFPELTPAQGLTGWHREFCIELLGDRHRSARPLSSLPFGPDAVTEAAIKANATNEQHKAARTNAGDGIGLLEMREARFIGRCAWLATAQ